MSLRKEITKECDNFFSALVHGQIRSYPRRTGNFCKILNHEEIISQVAIHCSHIYREEIQVADKAFICTVIYFCLLGYDFPLIVDCVLNEYKCVRGISLAPIFHAWISEMYKINFGNIFNEIINVK